MAASTVVTRPSLTQLKRQAKELLDGFAAGDDSARQRVVRGLPRLSGDSTRIVGLQLQLADAQFVVARENGYDSWPKLKAYAESGQGGPTPFLRAVLAVVDGDIEGLQSMLTADPALIHRCSPEAHRARLLHYIAANGVENHLQRTPPNAAEVCRLLLKSGADVDSPCETYGGGPNQTTMNLLVSSLWPHRAGLQAKLVEVLLDAGAAIDGPMGDGAPLRTALQHGYTDTARTLERRGARVDALDLAAGLGQVEALDDLWDAAPVDMDDTRAGWQPGLGGRFQAFILACRNNQPEACLRLQVLGIDIDTHPADGGTGLHEAILWNHVRVVQALLAHGASTMIKHGRWQARALDFASYNGRLACVQVLLDHGELSDQDTAADLEESLVSAVSQDHLDVARILCTAGATRERALARARELGLEDMVSMLTTT